MRQDSFPTLLRVCQLRFLVTIAPHVTGLGGGGFAVVRSSNGSYESIDFREAAPAAAFEDMFKNNVPASLTGGLAR